MWWLLACPKRGPDAAEQIEALLVRADRAYDERADGGLEAVSPLLIEAYGLDVHHPGTAWRFARLQVTQGLSTADPVEARSAFAEARASADRCLRDDPAFVARQRAQGLEEALAVVAPDRRPCVAWLALAWVRWTIVLGPEAAALDLQSIDLYLDTAERYGERELQSVVRWAQGVSLAVRPAWAGRDLSRARVLLDEAIAEDRDALVRQVDRNRFVLAVLSAEEASEDRARILSRRAETPEDIQAVSVLTSIE